MRRNYQVKLSQEITSILCRGKCGNYRDTGVSKNIESLDLTGKGFDVEINEHVSTFLT